MPISELCSSFYLFKPLEKCVLLDTRGMGYESVAWYESISITGQKQQKSHVLLRRCQWCYSSPVKTVRPVTLLLVPQLSFYHHQHVTFLFSWSSAVWALNSSLGELSMRGNSPDDLWHPFQQTLIEWQFFGSQISPFLCNLWVSKR